MKRDVLAPLNSPGAGRVVISPHSTKSSPVFGSAFFASFLQIGTGWLTVALLYNAWDFIFFPTAIWKLGPLWGGVFMGIADLLVCLVLIRIYVAQKKDWLGFEIAKQWISSLDPTRWTAKILKYSLGNPLLAFVVLSWRYDPFVTTAFFSSPGCGTLTRKRWLIFSASWLFGNTAWTLVCFGCMEAVESAWKLGQSFLHFP